MMYEAPSGLHCRSCGAPLAGAFCGRCGRPAGYPAPPTNASAWRSTPQNWHKPRSYTGIVITVAICLVAFVALPIGAIVHSLLSSGDVRGPAGAYGWDDNYGWYDEYGGDEYGSGGEYGGEYGYGYGDEYGGEYGYGYDLAPNETSNVRLVVLSTSRGDPYGMAAPGHTYLTVEIGLLNIGYEAMPYATTNFELAFPSGNLIAPQDDASLGASTTLGEGRLLPQGEVSGTLVFLVPENEYVVSLFYSDPISEEFVFYPLA